MSNASDLRPPGEKAGGVNLFGRHRLIADIGRGGMADVYLAVTEGTEAAAQFQKLLVIKMLRRELGDDPEFVRMFLNEARLAARLNHPNIVQTLEVGNAGGRYFLAMEYLEGQPLQRVCRNDDARNNLSLAMRLHILVQALGGLHYAHERKDYDGSPLDIVHRDVSPSNVFVTYDGQVKLMDFGIAKARDSDAETRVGVFKGKAAYIAPEQVRGEPADRRADVYSAGVLLWELITRRRLWTGLTQSEILRRVVAGDVTRPSTVDPRLPPELEQICMRSLAFRKEDRYETASELASEIERFAEHVLPVVIARDVGSVITHAFTEDRDRIREVVEAQLSRQPAPDASLPELKFMVDTGRNSTHFDPTPSDIAFRNESPGTTATLAAQPMVTGSALVLPRSRWRRGLWSALIITGALATAGASVTYYRQSFRPPPAPAPAAIADDKPVLLAPAERGVSENEIKIGMSAVFSGPSRELGQNMKLGVETSFQTANELGGVHGRKLSLTALDDGYEASRVSLTMQALIEERDVFAIVGNVGTPTSAVAAPFAAQHKTVFFGAFTGAPVLRQDPPDRYVFNYRASYKEETAKSLKYLLEVQQLPPEQIVVFAQEDSYGDAGFEGVEKAMRTYGHGNVETLRIGYKRNTADVDAALARLIAYTDQPSDLAAPGAKTAALHSRRSVKAVVMVATYRAAAKFIQKVRGIRRFKDTLFFNVSFVGSETLAEELKSVDPALCPKVYVTQVVPPFDSGATGVLRYREQLAKYQPQEQPGFVSLEGYIVGSIFVEALKRVGPELTSEKLVDELERVEALDLGFGTKISYSLSEHQGSHRVWGTRLDETCTYRSVDLD